MHPEYRWLIVIPCLMYIVVVATFFIIFSFPLPFFRFPLFTFHSLPFLVHCVWYSVIPCVWQLIRDGCRILFRGDLGFEVVLGEGMKIYDANSLLYSDVLNKMKIIFRINFPSVLLHRAITIFLSIFDKHSVLSLV